MSPFSQVEMSPFSQVEMSPFEIIQGRCERTTSTRNIRQTPIADKDGMGAMHATDRQQANEKGDISTWHKRVTFQLGAYKKRQKIDFRDCSEYCGGVSFTIPANDISILIGLTNK